MECTKKTTNLKCPCTYDCPRHGICCECVAHHVSRGNFVACFFSAEAEKKHDRSYAVLKADREEQSKCLS